MIALPRHPVADHVPPRFARILRAAAVLTAALLTSTTSLAAQVCLGLPAPEAARYTAGAVAEGDRRTHAFGVRLARLAPSSFVGASASMVRDTDRDADAVVLGGSFGAILPIETVRRARLCPYLALSYADGPDYTVGGIDIANRTASLTGYLAVGMTLETGRVALLPFARIGAQVRDVRQRRSRGMDTLQIISNDVGGLVGGGVGVRIGPRFTVTPSVTVPVIGFPGASALVGLSATIGFGRPAVRPVPAAARPGG